MHGAAKPRDQRTSRPARPWFSRGKPGTDVYLVLDGIVRVEHDGEPLAEYGPGAMLGERAGPGGGHPHGERGHRGRTCKVASVDGAQFEQAALQELSGGTAGKRRALSPAARPDRSAYYLCGVARLTPGHRRAVRPIRRRHVLRGGVALSGLAAGAAARRGNRPGPMSPELLGGEPFHRHRCCSPTCTGTTPSGCPSSWAATGTTRGSPCCCPARRTGTGAEELLAQVMSPPVLPIRRPGCAATGGSGRFSPRPFKAEGSHRRGAGGSRTRAAASSVSG